MWTTDTDDYLMHCDRRAYWEDCQEHDECYVVVCSKCQESMPCDE